MTRYNCAHRSGPVMKFVIALLTLLASGANPVYADTPQTTSRTTSEATGTTFNLSDFGPTADGVTDDGPAFQKAIDAVAQAGGGTLFIPAGTYFIATAVTKDFGGLSGPVTIQGVPSLTMPAPPNANGQQLSAGLNLLTEVIPATGNNQNAFTFTNIKRLSIEHISFSGRPSEDTDALITLNLSDIEDATIHHCEFYGLSSMGGGNIVRAMRSSLSIELSVFLGCTANSAFYAPTVENLEWRKFSITDSIFLDYGQRAFFGKTGLGSPFSWINVAYPAAPTTEFPRRELVVRDVFLDEGGWIGITATPYRWSVPYQPIDLVYISGLKMNVSNFGTYGHAFFDVRDVMIENSYYGWSHNATAAVSINRVANTIFDNLTCAADATHLHADELTQQLTVINSEYEQLDSQAKTTNVIETAPEQDPVQYVRNQFIAVLGKQPDPAAHFYWSDLLLRCGEDNECLDEQRATLNEYLSNNPQPTFSLAGTVRLDSGQPISGALVTLTGSHTSSVLSDSQGNFRFSRLPTSGRYAVAVNKTHLTFDPASQTFLHPTTDQNVVFNGSLNRHTISGRIVKTDGSGLSGITVKLVQSTTTVTTDEDGNYAFPNLVEGDNYTVTPVAATFGFLPASRDFDNLPADQTANFVAKTLPQILTMDGSTVAVALESVTFMAEPFSLLSYFGFGGDGTTRVMVFASNLEVDNVSQVSAVLEDEWGQSYPVQIEYLGDVPGQGWLKQLNLKLTRNIPSVADLQLRISIAEGTSNRARLRFSASH